MVNKFYQFKVELEDIEPSIWRKFVVPDDLSLDDFHIILQIVMGWNNSHLYLFEKDNIKYGEPWDEDDDMEELEASNYIIADVFKRKGEKMKYCYDFGDNWIHTITLEDKNYKMLDDKSFICLEGERACPPDDVGSIPGYEEFCEVMGNKKHENYKELLQWYGEHYNPENFNINNINSILAEFGLETEFEIDLLN